MKCNQKQNHQMWISAMALVTATSIATAGVSHADSLHDTTWMTDNETWDAGVNSAIWDGGAFFGFRDVNAADDFIVPRGPGYNITSVSGDFRAANAWGGEGVLIEFFQDIGGAPSNSPTASVIATSSNGLSISTFTPHVPSGTWTHGLRFDVDLSAAGITLGEGTWWMSMVPIHESGVTHGYEWLRTLNYQEGNELHGRDGGQAHGNGYPGTWGVNDWTTISSVGGGTVTFGDVAMKIKGIPAAPECAPADLNCDDVVDVFDLLILIGDWGPCDNPDDCPADLTGPDNEPDGVVDVFDLLELIANWG